MDILGDGIKRIFQKTDEIVAGWEDHFEATRKKLKEIRERGVKSAQDQRSSSDKKAKRLSTIADADCERNGAGNNETHLSGNPSKDEPCSDGSTAITASRPTRAVKTKIENNLKEKPLNCKVRRPEDAEMSSKKQIKVKEERNSDTNEYCNGDGSKSRRKKELVKRKSDDANKYEATKDVGEPPKKVKVDESLVIVNNNELVVIEVSDDDAAKLSKDTKETEAPLTEASTSTLKEDETAKMPPPTTLPKKKNLRKGQKEAIVIKKENTSLGKNINETKVTIVSDDSEKTVVNIKKEKDDVFEMPPKSGRTRGRRRKPFHHKPIKEEECEEDQLDSATINEGNQISKRSSLESVYEDAVSQDVSKEVEQTNRASSMKQAVVKLKKLELPITDNVPESSPNKQGDGTFISARNVPLSVVPASDATFVANSCPQSTFIMPTIDTVNNQSPSKIPNVPEVQAAIQCNTTFAVNGEKGTLEQEKAGEALACNDATFKVNTSECNKDQDDIAQNSLLTDDESEEEPVPIPVKPKSKKQIFNPFIQSPVKKKVEAFEKHASTVTCNTVEQRQTRARNKAKENKEPKLTNADNKTNTPILSRNLYKFLTPTQQSNISPINANVNKKLPSSASKLLGPTKVITKTSTSSKTQSLSRDSSAEDPKRGLVKLQQLAEEKKKKREQKQQMAAQLREAKEKERAEKFKKIIEEREEKTRKKALEAEQKRQLEEINRNLKLQEEKLEAQRRLEKQKQIEMPEAAKKEREMLENMRLQKLKDQMQLKLRHNQNLIAQKVAKSAERTNKPKYDFDMLNSGDSTDEEDKVTSKRPPPPSWSKTTIRQLFIERQVHLPTKIIDSFFSVQPMTPDLKEIFPKIDPRNLKRNSSIFWRTPPRYSELPKY